jgi:hypothetical protein
MPRLLTIGAIAESLDVAPERVAYAVRTRRIKPTARAGTARVWKQTDVAAIKAALDEIKCKRSADARPEGVVPFVRRTSTRREGA